MDNKFGNWIYNAQVNLKNPILKIEHEIKSIDKKQVLNRACDNEKNLMIKAIQGQLSLLSRFIKIKTSGRGRGMQSTADISQNKHAISSANKAKPT